MRSQNRIPLVFAALAATLAGCSSARDAMEGHQNIVASAAGLTLTIERAAQLSAASIPRSVTPSTYVDHVVDQWLSYALVATELTSPDEFADLDMGPVIEDDVRQSAFRRLYQDLIAARVDSSDAALRTSYELEQPFLRVEAYQIFISTSAATGAELDSLGRLAEAIHQRALRGEDFSRLARQYSQDPTSAPQGGYLGWVDRGNFLADLDAKLLAMQPGEVSETVRSAFGYHIFKVTDRDSPDFESVRDSYRRLYMQRRIDELETAFVDSLVEAADVRITQGAVKLVKRLAQNTGFRRLSTVTRSAVLARYRGGAVTVGDWATSFNGESLSEQRIFAQLDSAAIHDLLSDLTRDKLIVEAATKLGYTITEDEHDSYVQAARRNLRTLARELGLNRQDLVGGGESGARAIERAVGHASESQALAEALCRLSMPLFRTGTFQVHEDRYPAIIDRVLAIHQEQSQ
jgi:hypothetical protein